MILADAAAAAAPAVDFGAQLWAQVAPTVLTIVSSALVAVLTWGANEVRKLIAAKVHNEQLAGALTRLNDAVFAAVKEVEQTTAAALREANADGKITEEEKKQIKEAAITAAKSYLGPKGIGELVKVMGFNGDADERIAALVSGKIEAAVHDIKAASGEEPPKAVPL